MDLQVKQLKPDISATPRQNAICGPYHHSQDRDKLLIPLIKGDDYENLFRNVLL